MSSLHSSENIEIEMLSFKTEIIEDENIEKIVENNITTNQIECVKEEYEDENENMKLEDDILLKEEIEEFIDDQFDPNYDGCNDQFQYISSLSDEIDYLKKIPKEELEEVKKHIVHDKNLSREPSTVEPSCSDCNLQCKLTHDLKFHTLKEHNKQLNHHCTTFEDSFEYKQDLKQHNCHDKNLKAKGKEYLCSECSETFRFPRELKIHLKAFHKSDKLRCFYCSLTFDKKCALKSHMRSHKRGFKQDYVCEVCGRVFNFQSNLARHMKIHSGHKPYLCETCGKEFSRLDHLKVHKQMRKHEDLMRESSETYLEESLDVEEFVCEICGQGFRIKQRLRDHLKLHTENRPHICKVCNRAFKQIYNLKQHLLSHDGPRDFICDVCTKGFKRKAFLKQHMLVHTKEKKYVCEICGKRYYKSCHVTEHKKRVHDSPKLCQETELITKKRRPISSAIAVTCDTCNKVFQHKSALAQHVLTHEG